MSYTQLSVSERNQFYQLRTTTDLSMRAISGKIGRSQSPLSRELARNQSREGMYLPDSAQQTMEVRRQQSKSAFSGITERCIAEIKARLKQYHSPEQIAGRIKREGQGSIQS